MTPAERVQRLTTVTLVCMIAGMVFMSVAQVMPQPWRTWTYVGGGISYGVFAIGILAARKEMRKWDRLIDPQARTKPTARERWRRFLSMDSWTDPFDPIRNQLMRSLGGIILIASFWLSIAGVFWWWSTDTRMTPPSALVSAFFVLIVANLPAGAAFLHLQQKYAKAEPPLHGPWLPICPLCGYDCRSSPHRCSECGFDFT